MVLCAGLAIGVFLVGGNGDGLYVCGSGEVDRYVMGSAYAPDKLTLFLAHEFRDNVVDLVADTPVLGRAVCAVDVGFGVFDKAVKGGHDKVMGNAGSVFMTYGKADEVAYRAHENVNVLNRKVVG